MAKVAWALVQDLCAQEVFEDSGYPSSRWTYDYLFLEDFFELFFRVAFFAAPAFFEDFLALCLGLLLRFEAFQPFDINPPNY